MLYIGKKSPSIRRKNITIQLLSSIMITIIFVLVYNSLFQPYYFNKKKGIIKKAYKYVASLDMTKLENTDSGIQTYINRNLNFVIADEKFENALKASNLLVVSKKNSEQKQEARKNLILEQSTVKYNIDKYIKKNVLNFKKDFQIKETKKRISGFGYVTQNKKRYYIYIYEDKVKISIGFLYTRGFIFIIGVAFILIQLIIGILNSESIRKPIKNIERVTKNAPAKNYSEKLSEKNGIKELDSLSVSINGMQDQIVQQMEELEQQLQYRIEADERKREFLNNVSHEMKTPLAIISSQVEMLSLIDDPEKKQEYCQSVIEETQGLGNMINELIVLYDAQSENRELNFVEKNISELVGKVCTKNSAIINNKGINIVALINDDYYAVVNERYIEQAVDNYVSNAVKHSKNNSDIIVKIEEIDGMIKVSVSNKGPLIDEKFRDVIWNKFYTGDKVENLSGQKGSGLGLYMVKNVIEIHHGIYGFNNLKDGVEFYFAIPKEQRVDEKITL